MLLTAIEMQSNLTRLLPCENVKESGRRDTFAVAPNPIQLPASALQLARPPEIHSLASNSSGFSHPKLDDVRNAVRLDKRTNQPQLVGLQ